LNLDRLENGSRQEVSGFSAGRGGPVHNESITQTIPGGQVIASAILGP
jgi:hypothetical protein